jgi:hypothetical protein
LKLDELDSRDNIGLVLNSMGLIGTGVEVGVAFGENAEQILLKSKLSRLLLVDPWDYVPDQSPVGYGDMIKDWQGCYNYCRNKLAAFEPRAVYLKTTSLEASKLIADGSLDFVYIDANHMSPFIDEDLRYWYPKVKSGGIFSGHDYHDYENSIYTCNVKTAVDKFINEYVSSFRPIYIVPGEVPSWYVVKP